MSQQNDSGSNGAVMGTPVAPGPRAVDASPHTIATAQNLTAQRQRAAELLAAAGDISEYSSDAQNSLVRNLEVETAASFFNFDANYMPARVTMKLVVTWLSGAPAGLELSANDSALVRD